MTPSGWMDKVFSDAKWLEYCIKREHSSFVYCDGRGWRKNPTSWPTLYANRWLTLKRVYLLAHLINRDIRNGRTRPKIAARLGLSMCGLNKVLREYNERLCILDGQVPDIRKKITKDRNFKKKHGISLDVVLRSMGGVQFP